MSSSDRPFSAWTNKMAYTQAFTRSSLPVDHRRHGGGLARLARLTSHRAGTQTAAVDRMGR